jgi:hypothetical protein
MVHRGEDAKVFGDQQDGSHPGRQAIDTVHKKTLSYDISWIQHSSLAMFDKDASRCYDCIVVSLSTIAALCLGMRRKVTRMQATALALMTYFIKTMHGISDASYRSSKLYQLFGTGQGSGGSPSIWLSIMVVLLQTLWVMAHMAMSFADPWGDIMHEHNANSYVDDTSTSIMDATMDEPLPLPDMFANMQDVAQKFGTNPLQFWLSIGTAQVLLVPYLLGMGHWQAADDAKSVYSWRHCSYSRSSSEPYHHQTSGSLAGNANTGHPCGS